MAHLPHSAGWAARLREEGEAISFAELLADCDESLGQLQDTDLTRLAWVYMDITLARKIIANRQRIANWTLAKKLSEKA